MVRVYHESLDKELVSAEETLSSGLLTIRNTEQSINLAIPVEQLHIEKGGSNNQLFLVTSPSKPGWTIYVRDYELIKSLRAEAPQLKVPRKNLLDTGFSIAVAAVLAVVVLLVAAYFLKGPLVEMAVEKFPKEYEVYIGKTLINQAVGAESGRYEKARQKLEVLLQPLVDVAKEEGYDLKIYINGDDSLNAFALPGGFVAFNTGFLLAVDSPEEILGVAGHELAHVTKRHSLNQLMQTVGTYTVLQVVFGDVTGVAGILVDNSHFLLSHMYSRDAEKEADLVGIEYLYSKGISAKGLPEFFKKVKKEMAEMLEDQPEALKALSETSFLSTHPAPDDRLDYLKTEIDRYESNLKNELKPVEFDLESFKQALKDAKGLTEEPENQLKEEQDGDTGEG
ncbi:MAG: M48 family metallopeptidase [Bdellovibrionales bacterium]|nr:M48 family metallopeptidase [Bdellovibrionales bacterium]